VKVAAILISVVAVAFAAFLFMVDSDRRWAIVNGSSAEEYAISLLEGDDEVETPDRFIDYSISASDGYVVFSRHDDHDTVYGYFPAKAPSEMSGAVARSTWKSLGGKWFVSHP
jgi:hypothetical protein